MIALMVIMGVVALILSFVVQMKVKEITEVWSLSSEENLAISANLSEKAENLDGLGKRFKLF